MSTVLFSVAKTGSTRQRRCFVILRCRLFPVSHAPRWQVMRRSGQRLWRVRVLGRPPEAVVGGKTSPSCARLRQDMMTMTTITTMTTSRRAGGLALLCLAQARSQRGRRLARPSRSCRWPRRCSCRRPRRWQRRSRCLENLWRIGGFVAWRGLLSALRR